MRFQSQDISVTVEHGVAVVDSPSLAALSPLGCGAGHARFPSGGTVAALCGSPRAGISLLNVELETRPVSIRRVLRGAVLNLTPTQADSKTRAADSQPAKSLISDRLLAAAAGISFWILFTEVFAGPWRKPLAIVTGLLRLVELYPVHSAYWTHGLDRQLFTDYQQAAAFLKTAPIQGTSAVCF